MPKKNGKAGMGVSFMAILIAMAALLAQVYPGFDFIDRDAPIVGILDPNLGEQVSGTITIRGIVYEMSNYTLSIRINETEIGTQLPLQWNSSLFADGNYTLSILATDTAFNQGMDQINISIINDVEWDSDHDGLPDHDELLLGTNPLKIDTDLDNYNDGYEVSYGSDPLNASDYPLMHEADFDALLKNLESNASLVQQLIEWSNGNSSTLQNLILSVENNATLVQSLMFWCQGNATMIQDLITWSAGNASIIQTLIDWSSGNSSIIANLVATSNTELIQNLQLWLEGNATLLQELCGALEGNATLLANLVQWSDANSTLMVSLIGWCAENATLLQDVITWTAGNASLLQDHISDSGNSGGNITRMWFSQHLGGLMHVSVNTPEIISQLNITFTITGIESVYLNFNSGQVALYGTHWMKVNFVLDDVLITNPKAWVQLSSVTSPDYVSITLQHILEGLDIGTHTITIQFESDYTCFMSHNSFVVLTFSD